ncbi:hypothetical protein AAIB41_11590 [Brucella sp. BE17]|uniref:hypothetical protein n=1 Tax=Brucella sp. BE17 TaxID=3142977 RepID=UPI0031BABEF9
MIMYFLPLKRRLVAFVFPLLIILLAVVTTPTFVQAGLPWWPLFIFALPGLLALVICVEYWNVAIGFSDTHVQFQSVGYQVEAPWSKVSERSNKGRIVLLISECEPHYAPWLGLMQRALSILMPGRARYAHGMMATIPLFSFSTAPNDAVMNTYRRLVPRSGPSASSDMQMKSSNNPWR